MVARKDWFKNGLLASVCVCLLVSVLPLPACAQTFNYLKKYDPTQELFQAQYDHAVLLPLKALISLQEQELVADRSQWTFSRQQLWEEAMALLETELSKLAHPASHQLKPAQIKQLLQINGMKVERVTYDNKTILLKQMYLLHALFYYQAKQMLSTDELRCLWETLFPGMTVPF